MRKQPPLRYSHFLTEASMHIDVDFYASLSRCGPLMIVALHHRKSLGWDGANHGSLADHLVGCIARRVAWASKWMGSGRHTNAIPRYLEY
jgi:hypothetical protein